jgi:hypothetical protein
VLPDPTVCPQMRLNPKQCCYGACLDPATHVIVLTTKNDSLIDHLRCPTHLAWSKDRQAADIESIRSLNA